MWRIIGFFIPLAVGLPALIPSTAVALNGASEEVRVISVPLNKSRTLNIERRLERISIGNPNVADILLLRSSELYIVGKALGTTNVVLWDRDNRVVEVFDVEVTHDLTSLKTRLHELMPDEKVGVHTSQGALVLTGQVSGSDKVDTAVRVARSFIGRDSGSDSDRRLINLLQVGGAQQVMLEVQVAEVGRTLTEQLGVNFHAAGTDSNITFGALRGGGALNSDAIAGGGGPITSAGEFLGSPLGITNGGLFASFLDGSTLFNAVINANRRNNLARVLAEPTLTTLTGTRATFTAGGEFPVPVPDRDRGTTIEYKEFGIGLGFLPVVLDSGRISLDVDVRVSELSPGPAVVLDVPNTTTRIIAPSVRSRTATSTVELADGQTMGIAGLIDENTRGQVDRFPGLGDIPVLGVLFRSKEFQKEQTELVILVTPRFARPAAREDYSLPTDNFVDPSRVNFYLFGRLGDVPPEEEEFVIERGAVEGRFGQEL